MKQITAFTDGACEPNPGLGGWGFHFFFKDEHNGVVVEWEDYGGEKYTTNNRMEMMAIINCIKSVPVGELVVHSDSQYSLKGIVRNGNGCFTEEKLGWVKGWKEKGWKTAGGGAVKNIELWEEMLKVCNDYLAKGGTIEFVWVKGHDGNEGNEKADSLANQGRKCV